MRITGFEVLIVEIPMRLAVEHTLAKRETARNVLVTARDETGRAGWGESCPRSYVTGETVETVREDLAERILPQFVGREFARMTDLSRELTGVLDGLRRDQQAAFCACELAVLDLAGKVFGVSAGSVLGPVLSTQVHYSGVIASEDAAGVEKYAGLMVQFGIKEVKVKVGAALEQNLEILRRARAVLGESVSLRVDANAAWSGPEAVRQLEVMSSFRLAGVEQPVDGQDLEGMKIVTAAGLVPVVADESLASVADAEVLIRERACNIFNLRVSKCGGLLNSGRLYRMAKEAGLRCQLGAQVGETGFLSAAGRHVATRCADVIWLEGSYDSVLLEENITEPDITVGMEGLAPALDTPGLGVEPVTERVDKYRTHGFRVG
jgi:muconate cycloisomerase